MSEALVVCATVCYCAQTLRRDDSDVDAQGFVLERRGDALSASAMACWALCMGAFVVLHPQRTAQLDTHAFTGLLLFLLACTSVARTWREWRPRELATLLYATSLYATLLCMLVPTLSAGDADWLTYTCLSLIALHWLFARTDSFFACLLDLCLAAAVHVHVLRT